MSFPRIAAATILILALSACVRQWARPAAGPAERGQTPGVPAQISDGEGVPTTTPSVLLPVVPLEPQAQEDRSVHVIFHDQLSLWLADLAGPDVAELTAGRRLVGLKELKQAVSPDGSHLAFLSFVDDRFHGLTLHVVSLPDGEAVFTLPLTSAATEPGANPSAGDPKLEIVRVLMEPGNLAWSPDGSVLAFVGAQEGPTSDLYVYEVGSTGAVRLTDGPSQALAPFWSPDGRQIIHAGVSGLGTGAGFGMEGVWSAAADGTLVEPLYDASGSGGEIWVGWYDRDTFIVFTVGAACGQGNLRTYRISDGTVRVLWAGTFEQIAFDAKTSYLLLSVEQTDTACNPAGMSGLVLTHPQAQDALQVWDDWVFALEWSPEANAFLAATGEESLLVTTSGDVMPLLGPPAGVPTFSPDGRQYAWTGPAFNAPEGVWVNDAGKLEKIFEGFTIDALWSPGGAELYFLGRNGLYRWQLGMAAVRVLAGYQATDFLLLQAD